MSATLDMSIKIYNMIIELSRKFTILHNDVDHISKEIRSISNPESKITSKEIKDLREEINELRLRLDDIEEDMKPGNSD